MKNLLNIFLFWLILPHISHFIPQMYPYKTKFEYCIFSYVQPYAFQYKKAGIPSFEDDCFCPLASSALHYGVCYSTFWVFLSAFRRLLFILYGLLPLWCLLFCFSGSAPSSDVCCPIFRHLLFRLRRCRLLFSFCGHSFKNPPTYAHV